jgi:3'-phosphoadenosine 5'-phosphosulfate sulfotransferase (PAPS reductase)/FAD synthetase
MREMLVKAEQAKEIIRKALFRARFPMMEFTGGKDSLVCLHLIREINNGVLPVLFIDTSAHFYEVYHFVEKMRKLWKLNLLVEKDEEGIRTVPIGRDRSQCCYRLKTKVRLAAVRKYGIDYLFTGLKIDDPEEEQVNNAIQGTNPIAVYPLADFRESEVWEYIKENNLPRCSLYTKGYSHLDCAPCTSGGSITKPSEETNSEEIMKKLKQLGYL